MLFSADLKHLQNVGGDDEAAAGPTQVKKVKSKQKVDDEKVTKQTKRKKKV